MGPEGDGSVMSALEARDMKLTPISKDCVRFNSHQMMVTSKVLSGGDVWGCPCQQWTGSVRDTPEIVLGAQLELCGRTLPQTHYGESQIDQVDIGVVPPDGGVCASGPHRNQFIHVN